MNPIETSPNVGVKMQNINAKHLFVVSKKLKCG